MRNGRAFLTPKQLRWIDEYLVDFNGAAAAVRAGYSVKSARSIAHENLTKPDIQAVLRERQGVMAADLQITRQGAINGILEGIALAREQRVPAVMIRGWAEVARMLGFYEPETKRVELTADRQGTLQQLQAMSDQQLLTLIGQGTAAALT